MLVAEPTGWAGTEPRRVETFSDIADIGSILLHSVTRSMISTDQAEQAGGVSGEEKKCLNVRQELGTRKIWKFEFENFPAKNNYWLNTK